MKINKKIKLTLGLCGIITFLTIPLSYSLISCKNNDNSDQNINDKYVDITDSYDQIFNTINDNETIEQMVTKYDVINWKNNTISTLNLLIKKLGLKITNIDINLEDNYYLNIKEINKITIYFNSYIFDKNNNIKDNKISFTFNEPLKTNISTNIKVDIDNIDNDNLKLYEYNDSQYYINVNEKTAIFSKPINKNIANIVIPMYIEYNNENYLVNEIGEKAFQYNKQLTNVTFPSSIEIINNKAFDNCNSLKSIILPNNLLVIGQEAFSHCYSLSSVKFNNKLVKIGDEAFYQCWKLNNVIINDSLKIIGNNAFDNCKELETINLPNSTKFINSFAFYNCVSLKNINLPNSLTKINRYTFYNCKSLTTINFPSSITLIDDSAFYLCLQLDNILIHSNITRIGDSAFRGCSSLVNLTIQDGVKIIDKQAFAYCDELTTIKLPDSIESINDSAFYACKLLNNVKLPSYLKKIGNKVFYYCDSLKSVYFPETIIEFGKSMFYVGINGSNTLRLYFSSQETMNLFIESNPKLINNCILQY